MSAAFAKVGLLAVLLFGPAAFATVTVTSISHGDTVSGVAFYTTTSFGGLVDTSQSVANNTAIATGTAKYAKVNVGATYATDDGTNMLRFVVEATSQSALTDGSVYAIEAKLTAGTGSTKGTMRVPIAGIGGVKCSNSLCRAPSGSNFLAANYNPGDQIEVDLYPADLCYYYANTGIGLGTGSGCSGTAVDFSGASAMGLEFHVVKLVNDVDEPSTIDSAALSLRFKDSVSPLVCNNITSASTMYFPGDEEIIVNTDQIGLSSQSLAPQTRLLVVADTAPVTLDTTFNNHPVVDRIGFGGNQSATGFTNSTQDTPVVYNVKFMVRDASGALAQQTGSSTECAIPNPPGVQTASIRGFLEKGQCFIATAAFRGYNNPAVHLLQAFRDQVLKQSAPGRWFVATYYRLSPPAAEWLIDHPAFRYPVLFALAPLQIVAWFVLHGIAATAIAVLLLLSAGLGAFWARRSLA